MKIVLKPYWIAEKCFLYEALMWVGFQRFPLSEIVPNRADGRFAQYSQGYRAWAADDHGFIDSQEALRAGLPANPEWEVSLHDPDVEFLADSISDEKLQKPRFCGQKIHNGLMM